MKGCVQNCLFFFFLKELFCSEKKAFKAIGYLFPFVISSPQVIVGPVSRSDNKWSVKDAFQPFYFDGTKIMQYSMDSFRWSIVPFSFKLKLVKSNFLILRKKKLKKRVNDYIFFDRSKFEGDSLFYSFLDMVTDFELISNEYLFNLFLPFERRRFIVNFVIFFSYIQRYRFSFGLVRCLFWCSILLKFCLGNVFNVEEVIEKKKYIGELKGIVRTFSFPSDEMLSIEMMFDSGDLKKIANESFFFFFKKIS
jgi:hypothetical protein